jgi:hypothetical protein
MTLEEFENALLKLLEDAVESGLSEDDVQNCAEAIINNTFLDDQAET